MLGLNLSLLDQLAFYGAYHNNKWNQIIHFFFVPMIMWSAMVWFSYTGPLQFLEPINFMGVELNLNFVLTTTYFLYYLVLDFFVGLSWGIFVGIPLCLSATAFCQQVDGAWAWAIGAHVLGWYAQIHPGHIIFEQRRPALLDSLVQVNCSTGVEKARVGVQTSIVQRTIKEGGPGYSAMEEKSKMNQQHNSHPLYRISVKQAFEEYF